MTRRTLSARVHPARFWPLCGPSTLRGALHPRAVLTVMVAAAACGTTLGIEDLSRLEFHAGNGQTATVGAAVATPPAVRATDIEGSPIAGLTIVFTIAAGAGDVLGGSATTDANGVATVGSWTLGPQVGSNALTATAQGAEITVRFLAIAEVGPPGIVAKIAGDDQTATAGLPIPVDPEVRVTDEFGNPVSGVAVTFTIESGGGTIGDFSVSTNAEGMATAPEWTLGATPGVNTVLATAGATAATFTATGVSGPVAIAGTAGDAQTATVGQPLPIAPRVVVTDALGLPVEGADVAFTLLSGGGAISTEIATTAANGEAAVDWTIGTASGENQVTAGIAGVGIVFFTATGSPDAPVTMEMVSGDRQFGAVGEAVTGAPRVRVADRFDNPVPDVSVTFAATGGGGSVTGPATVTDNQGIARPGEWVLGPTVGTNMLDATTPGLPTVSFTATALSAVFDIEVIRLGAGGPAVAQAITDAVVRWQGLIVGDLPEVSFATNPLAAGTCGPSTPEVNDIVDDVRIYMRLENIDGPGGVLGSAGPCFLRDVGELTVIGSMRFDIEDLDRLADDGRLTDVIIHEIGHILGIGTLWDNLDMLENPSLPNSEGADTHFTGPRAIAAFDAVGGANFSAGSKVPVENTQGGAGTRDSHWRESVFESEVMTGFIDRLSNPLSLVTVESLADLGYEINADRVDEYTIPGGVAARRAGSTLAGRPGIHMLDDVRRGPIYFVERDGRITTVIQR